MADLDMNMNMALVSSRPSGKGVIRFHDWILNIVGEACDLSKAKVPRAFVNLLFLTMKDLLS